MPDGNAIGAGFTAAGYAKIDPSWFSLLAPPSPQTVSELADAYRMLGETSAKPGRWSTDTTPYLREPMDRLGAGDPCWSVRLMWCTQVGKSEAINNWLAWVIVNDPSVFLMIQPSIARSVEYSRDRIAPMISASAKLRDLVASPTSRDGSNTLAYKSFPGGYVKMIGAEAPSGLASTPAPRYAFDEIDRAPESSGKEGDPLELLRRRAGTFADHKELITSTPVIKGRSRIARLMDETGWREYHLPCPHCATMAPLERAGLTWPEGQPELAAYHCQSCGVEIEEADKDTMLAAGRWVPRYPERETGAVYGYHLTMLYAPLCWPGVGWNAVARICESAKGNPLAEQVVENTVWAMPYDADDGETIAPSSLMTHVESYAAEVPAGVALLTAGVDVQANRIEVEIVGWGKDWESWQIGYHVLYGDPQTSPQIWRDLDAILLRRLQHETAGPVNIAAVAVDSGFDSEAVQRWCYDRRGRNVVAVKGSSSPTSPVWPKRGSSTKWSAMPTVWIVGVSQAKAINWSRMKVPAPGPGYMHLPETAPEDWGEQMTSERPVTKIVKGEVVTVWIKDRVKRAESLDCRCYAYAAAVGYLVPPHSLDEMVARIPPKVTLAAGGGRVADSRAAPEFRPSRYWRRGG